MQRCVRCVTCVLFLAFGPAKKLPGFLLVISLRFSGSGCFGFRYFCSLEESLANELSEEVYVKKVARCKSLKNYKNSDVKANSWREIRRALEEDLAAKKSVSRCQTSSSSLKQNKTKMKSKSRDPDPGHRRTHNFCPISTVLHLSLRMSFQVL